MKEAFLACEYMIENPKQFEFRNMNFFTIGVDFGKFNESKTLHIIVNRKVSKVLSAIHSWLSVDFIPCHVIIGS